MSEEWVRKLVKCNKIQWKCASRVGIHQEIIVAHNYNLIYMVKSTIHTCRLTKRAAKMADYFFIIFDSLLIPRINGDESASPRTTHILPNSICCSTIWTTQRTSCPCRAQWRAHCENGIQVGSKQRDVNGEGRKLSVRFSKCTEWHECANYFLSVYLSWICTVWRISGVFS